MYKIIGGDGKEYGPVTGEQIRQWLVEGRLNGQTQICREGTTDWKALSAFPEFSAGTVSSPVTSSQPPVVIKVFGILNIVFGAMGLLCSPFSMLAMPMMMKMYGDAPLLKAWFLFSIVLGMVGGVILLISGIGLVRNRAWARKVAVYYAMFAMTMNVIGLGIMLMSSGSLPPEQRWSSLIGAVVGTSVGLVYNALLVYFLTRPRVKQALGEPV